MLKKIRKIVTVVVVVIFIAALINVVGIGPGAHLGVLERIVMGVFAVILGIVLWAIIYYWYGNDNKCPSCGNRFCMKKIETDILEKEDISMLVRTNVRNNAGDIVGTQEQYVPGERITYATNYECKKCGEKAHRIFTKDCAKI